MKTNKSNHSLKNSVGNIKGEDTQIKGVSERNFNLVYYFILGNPTAILDISISTRLPLETVFKTLQHLKEKQLLNFCCHEICEVTKTRAYKYYIKQGKEGDDE